MNDSVKESPKVSIVHSAEDAAIAQRIVEGLRDHDIDVQLSNESLLPGQSALQELNELIAVSDYIIVLFSENFRSSTWLQDLSRGKLATLLANRAITLLPVVIGDDPIPTDIAATTYLKLKNDFRGINQGIEILAERLAAAKTISFNTLDWRRFENLVFDLLVELNFKDVTPQRHGDRYGRDLGYDLTATYVSEDPFGQQESETWLIQIKFYQASRVDLKSLAQFSGFLMATAGKNRGLIVTNGQLTSIARDWLADMADKSTNRIRVIDGAELRRLLLQHPSITENYFPLPDNV